MAASKIGSNEQHDKSIAYAWEVVEPCPYCGKDNTWENLDPIVAGYRATCQMCGETIMLCDECLHSDDNPGMFCDWHKCEGCESGTCFRKEQQDFDRMCN